MNIKLRLIVLNFLEFFIWGSWLLSAGAYMTVSLGFSGIEVGAVYATMGVASLFMPTVLGTLADRWMSAHKLFAICHFILIILVLGLTTITSYNTYYLVALLISCLFMPTLALNNSISYYLLGKYNMDVVKSFPPIRVWGTVGFILAAWCVDFFEWKTTIGQFYLSAAASAILGIYALSLPDVPPVKSLKKQTWKQRFGFDAFILFQNRQMAVFLIFSVLLGATLQITNIWGVPFLSDFSISYPESFVVRRPVLLITLSQISETFFILAIPFFFKKYGIKTVMIMSLVAWVFRFGLFGVGSPEGMGLTALILSMIVYGVAFDFFFISGSLYVDKTAAPEIRSGAQGLFMLMTSGLGPIIGGYGSGLIVDFFTTAGTKNWTNVWFVFALYALLIAVFFQLTFKYKHET